MSSTSKDLPDSKPKKWGKADKKNIRELISVGSIDINNLLTKAIDAVHYDYFSHRDKKNFRRNFCDFAAKNALESEYSGARRQKGE